MYSTWRPISSIDFAAFQSTHVQYFKGLQYAAMVARKYLEKSKDDSNSTFAWNRDFRWLESNTISQSNDIKIIFEILNAKLGIADLDGNIKGSISINGKSHRQILVWLEEQLAHLQMDVSQLELNPPYELGDLFGKKPKSIELNDLRCCEEIEKYFDNGELILAEVKKAFKSSDVRCWPKNMDLTTRIIVNNTGNIQTSSYTTVGISFGDNEITEPYFYAAPWPYPATTDLPELSCGGWVEEHWVGAVLKFSEIVEAEDQYKYVRTFISECFAVLRKVMIY